MLADSHLVQAVQHDLPHNLDRQLSRRLISNDRWILLPRLL